MIRSKRKMNQLLAESLTLKPISDETKILVPASDLKEAIGLLPLCCASEKKAFALRERLLRIVLSK